MATVWRRCMEPQKTARVLSRDAAHTNCLLQLIGKEWAYLAPEIHGSKGLDKSYICHLCYLALDKVVALHKKLEVVKQGIKEAEHGIILKFNQNISVAATTVTEHNRVLPYPVGKITKESQPFTKLHIASCLSFNVSTFSSVIAKRIACSTVSILTRSVWVWVKQCLCTYVIIKVHTNSSVWYTSTPYETPDLYECVYTLCDKHCVILVWGRD